MVNFSVFELEIIQQEPTEESKIDQALAIEITRENESPNYVDGEDSPYHLRLNTLCVQNSIINFEVSCQEQTPVSYQRGASTERQSSFAVELRPMS